MSAQTSAPRTRGVITSGTYLTAGVLVALAAIFSFLSSQMYAGTLSDGAYAAAYWYGTLLQVLLASVVISVALKIGLDQRVGVQWLLVGLGVASYAVGDIVWTVLDLHMGLDPYPSLADVFYVLQYVFFVAALALAVRSYKDLAPIRTPIMVAALVGLVLTAAVLMFLLVPYIFPAGTAELGFWGLVVSTFYPLGDVLLIFSPALALSLVIRQLGAGRLGWPWWIVVVGAIIFALTDTAYSYADWAGSGLTATLEMGWVVANLVFAVAALVARDAYRVR